METDLGTPPPARCAVSCRFRLRRAYPGFGDKYGIVSVSRPARCALSAQPCLSCQSKKAKIIVISGCRSDSYRENREGLGKCLVITYVVPTDKSEDEAVAVRPEK